MNDKTQKQLIQETHESVIKLSVVLLGMPDTEETGLVGEIKDIKINQANLDKKHNKLSQKFYILVAFLAGSGVLGVGVYGLLAG